MSAPAEAAESAAAPPTTVEGYYWERARRGAAPWIVGAVGLAAIGVGQFVPLRHHVESDLRGRSLAALQSAGLKDVTVDFTGRDGVLKGSVTSPADIDKALAVVRTLDGVRVATAQLKIPAAAAPAAVAAPPSVKAVTSGGKVTLTGTVGTEAAHRALVAAAAQTFGAGNVTDQVTVATSTSDAGVQALGPLLAALGTGSAATAQLTGGALTLTGSVTDAAALSAVTTAGAAVTGDAARVTSQLTAAPAAPPTDEQATARAALTALPPLRFDHSSSGLSPADQAVLRQVADVLKASPSVKLRLDGATDDIGDWDVNKALGQARADTARQALIALGIDGSRLTTFSWSADRPRVPNTSEANRAINRRVEFVVL